MSHEVDFDALSRKASESNGALDDLNALFGAAFALEQWHFIARGQVPNLYPYVASNADYADGQPMVRAFTDTGRLLRFAKENGLLNEDGGASDLSIPTNSVVAYLEPFMAQGVYGIWFNSHTQSEGFFLPLQQLRAVREHLQKLKPSRLEEFGPSRSPNVEMDLNLSLSQQGEIGFDTAIAPFYEMMVLLLENYQGSGEYTDMLVLDKSAMHDAVENIASNTHGTYLRIRRFLYRRDGAGVGINTVDSNQLRHIQTNAGLLVNFALCKNLDSATAKLYFRFQGPESEVFNFMAHITPLLKNCGFRNS